MPVLEKWTDFSKWQGPVGERELRLMQADGIVGVWPGAWHGVDANPYVSGTLEAAGALQMKGGTYTIINDRPGAFSVRAAQVAVGDANWQRLRFVAIDVELKFSEGVDGERIIRDAAAEIIRQGGRPVLYTGNWFWNWWALSLGHFPDVGLLPVIVAYYNGVPDLNVPTRPGYGPIVGHQYTGSTQDYGTTVDRNVLDQAWVDAWPLGSAPAPEPEPTPEPPEEGDDDMGAIRTKLSEAGELIESALEGKASKADMDKARNLLSQVRTKLDVHVTNHPGGGGAPAPAPIPPPTGTTYKVVYGDNLGEIALKYSRKWPEGLKLWGDKGAVDVLADFNGIDPNAGLSVGQVLKIPW